MEFLTSLASEAVSKLGALVVDSTVKQFKYMIHHNKIITNLKEEHGKLKAMRIALQRKVDADRRNELEIAPDVQDWLRKVEDIDNELERFYENEANKNKKCLAGRCPDVAFNYSLGKRATKRAQEIASLKEEENKFKLISYPKPQSRLGYLFTEDIKALGSRKAIIKDVMEKLKGEKIKRISICGMGGVGKTTLAKEVIKNVETSKLFDEVAMAVVSQNRDYEKIQIQIADMLGLDFKGKSMQGRAVELHERVSGVKKVLIVLDDVWDMLDFERIGLPSLEHQKGCKILFTSRDEKVCRNMGSRDNIIARVLSEDEAWYLFREMAGDTVDKPDIHHTAEQVAKECGGLPLALVTVARALENKEKHKWEYALDQSRDSPSSSFTDIQKFVYSRIEHSVNFLGSEEQKRCLLLCALYPEDFDIPIESIFRHGMFKVDGALSKTRTRVHVFIDDLKRCFLLLDSDRPGCVKMHDVVRDVVISIASGPHYGLFVQYNAELMSLQEENVDRIKAISLILDETKGLKDGLEYPALQLLQVRAKSKEPNPWPERFFKGMRKLRVLAMENLSIPKLPSLFPASTNFHTLQLEYCNIEDISVIGKELMKLEILSFAHSNIKEIPTEIGQLGFLRLLDLTACEDLYLISTNVLRRLSRLEELYFKVQNFPWMYNKDVLMELQSLADHLKVVEIKVRKVEVLPEGLTFKSLEKFWIYITPYSIFERRGYLESNMLQIAATNHESIKCCLMIKELVKKCEILKLEKVKDLKNAIYELDDGEFPLPYLKDLIIYSCPNLECLFDGTGPCNSFPQIRSLSLKNLGNLREICNVSDHHKDELMTKFLVKLELINLPSLTSFSKPIGSDEPTQPIDHKPGLSNAAQSAEFIKVAKDRLLSRSHLEPSGDKILPNTRKLFSAEWVQQFPNLETILLDSCTSLEMVFDLQGHLQLNDQSVVALFPQLKEIQVSYLDNLIGLWGNAPNYVQGFQNLRSLTISNCGSLRHAFTPAIVRAIRKLENLDVRYCELMESLVVDNRGEDQGDYNGKGEVRIAIFDSLNSLSLTNLPNIASICPASYQLELPSSRKLEIYKCPKLNISSLLTQAHAKNDNLSITSGVNNFEEKHPSTDNWHFGCTPLCSKLIRHGHTKMRSKKTMLASHDHVPSNSKRKLEMGHMPNLEELDVDNCELHDNSFLQEGDQMRMRHFLTIDGYLFPKLTSLTMKNCNNIIVLLSLSSLRILECLETLKVKNCNNIEEIISGKEVEASANKIMFPRLQHLSLGDLPNLKAFCQGSYHFDFPSLRIVKIKDCPSIEMFSGEYCLTPKLEDFRMTGPHSSSNYIPKGDFNATFQVFKAFEALHELEVLRWNVLCNEDISEDFITSSQIGVKMFHKISTFVPFSETHMLRYVKGLSIAECDSLVEVFESEGGIVAKKGFATTHYEIESIYLEKLPKLRDIWGPNITRLVGFNKLTSIIIIIIIRCDSLKSVLSQSMARSLVQLQILTVFDCDMIEKIVTMEDDNMDDGGNKAKTLFPKLETLYVINLPKLECVCSRDYGYDVPLCDEEAKDKDINNKQQVQISIPQLREFYLYTVPSLKCFCPGAYDYHVKLSSSCVEDCTHTAIFPNGNVTISTPNLHQVNSSIGHMRTMGDINLTVHCLQNSMKYKAELQKLETFRCLEQHQYQHLLAYITRETQLELDSCHKLINCVPYKMMHLFQHVLELTVKHCGCLEEIFESSDYEGAELRTLELHSLPKLKHIWRNHGSVSGFENLMTLIIRECHELKFVFPDVSVARSLPQLQRLEVRECSKMEEIISNNSRNHAIPKGAKIILPSLWRIELAKLSELCCFCPISSCFELPACASIRIEECPKMDSFCYGTVYTPRLWSLKVEGREFDGEEDVNEVIKETRQSLSL